ncbi:putative polysialyltransferase [Penicillium oxalicum 114-2]|uniref:Putative polysialyltransferase n=1 Tax=Penicillium oxalicum (strain 114-2 / CGMCC 5302) TaxID=933388 RepID=S7Z7Y6_PENO1|nr:putative polysialyltransferase [Penicillium oxalicum 114-2]
MAHGKILSVNPLYGPYLTEYWWQYFMIAVIAACVAIGLSHIAWSITLKSIKWYKSRPTPDIIPPDVAQRLQQLANRELNLSRTSAAGKKPASFGVYLGSFSQPLTAAEEKLLNQWDVVIVDPFEKGVQSATLSSKDSQVLGRIDIAKIHAPAQPVMTVVKKIEEALEGCFRNSGFSGVVFANWEENLTPAFYAKLFETIRELGLNVYLETQAPKFLKNRKALQNEDVSGLVIRNASIMPTGEKRDYFQLEQLQPTIKAFVSEACMRDFVVLAWETVDNDVSLSNAIVRRSILWCGFYSAISWIGREASLYDSKLNIPTTEPLPAFSWLKEADVMKVHEKWRANRDIASSPRKDTGWDALRPLLPALDKFLDSEQTSNQSVKSPSLRLREPPEWVAQIKSSGHPLSVSMSGQQYVNMGCFPLGSDPTPLAFAEILQSQQRLKGLELLHPVPATKIQSIGLLMRNFHEHLARSCQDAPLLAAIQNLSEMAAEGSLKVNLALDSGLKKTSDTRFWAVFEQDEDRFEVFVSKNAHGLAGTVLHTFLSGKGFSRHVSCETEVALARWSEDFAPSTQLPRRFVQDIDGLSPEERLLLLQHLSLTDAHSEVTETICAYIQQQLVDAPSLAQLRELNSVGYLEGSASAEELIEDRLSWYEEQGCARPSFSTSLDLFHQVDAVFTEMHKYHRENELSAITTGFCNLVQSGDFDAFLDMLALALFCTARKNAFDEIYAEVTDRNPLFNQHSDQAAAFAESFALGSRCEAYFGVNPSVFGKLLSDRFRAYYSKNQPPSWINGAPELATSYAGAQIDVNPEDKAKTMPSYQRFTFLSVFAIPSLIDIILLTLIGRGLYLSAYMTHAEQDSATMGLMISLLFSGAIGTMIACGGPYYLISMAFAAANMFVLIRLIAGIAFTVAGGLIGFIAISGVRGARAGIVFYLYLVGFTLYFSIFAALASFSYPGSSFLSGRKPIIYCIPVLFLSPIITTFTGSDSAVYLAVIYVFNGLLLLSLRSTLSKWVTWYQSIRRTDDTEVRKWYISVHGNNNEKVFGTMSEPAALKLARDALLNDIMAEKNRRMFTKPTTDQLVKELVRDWESTNFLLDWYCRYADVPRPIPFSSGWNIQTKVALDVLRNSQKGLRLHNAFVHWRQSSKEIGCGILYFLIALLDKWIQLLSGDRILGLTASVNDANRMAVGFALAYYLVGAVLIDVKAQELHAAIGGDKPTAVKSAKEIRAIQKKSIAFRRKVYWKTLYRYLLWHVWSLAFSTTLVWVFQYRLEAMGIFFSYVFAYSGLIWFQYTKIFTGPHALKPLLVGICVGLPLGIALKVAFPTSLYSQIIGLGVATWIIAILTFLNAKMGMPKKVDSPVELGKTFHAFTTPWADPEWSQQELQSYFENVSLLPADSRFRVDPNAHPGVEIKNVLLNRKKELRVEEAFPNSDGIIDQALASWENGDISLELVAHGSMGPGIRALSCSTGDHLKIAISVRGLHDERLDVSANCQIIAETLVHSVAEMIMGIPHEYAGLAEVIISGGVTHTVSRMLREEANTTSVMTWAKKELLRQLCLGFEPDIHWDKLPAEVRKALLNRCVGRPCGLQDSEHQWLQKSLCQFDTEYLDVHVARCNLGAAMAVSILEYTHHGTGESAIPAEPQTAEFISYVPRKLPLPLTLLRSPASYLYHKVGTLVKFAMVAMIADPEFQREFDHVTKTLPTVVRVPVNFLFNLVWVYGKITQDIGLSFFLFHGRKNVKQLWDETKGMTIHLKKTRVIIRGLDGTFTAFRHQETDGGFKVYQYSGEHKTEPKDKEARTLKYVSSYTSEMLLLIKQEFKDGKLVNEYHYDYQAPLKKGLKLGTSTKSRMPLGRRCVQGENHLQSIQYNSKGLVEKGSYMKDGNLIRFQYHYRKNPRFGDELLRAEFSLSHITCNVAWCAPPRRNRNKEHRWIPHTKVTEATFVQQASGDVYESRWLYDHKFHPTIFTTVNGMKVQTPPMIENDYLGVLAKPTYTSFASDNPFFYVDSLRSNVLTRALGWNKKRFAVSTSRSRSLMWKAWKDRNDLDGIIVRWMDDRILRKDEVLRPYWRSRDWGNLRAARKYMELRADAVMASADLDNNISSWTPLAVKISDFFNFGPGGDAVVTTRSREISSDTEDTLHVMAADNGTWPNEGGGVSACRRDMINSLRTIKWHMICESANDFGVPKHQTEKNVQSLKVIPLWGLDFMTPTHGLFSNKLDAEVENVTSASEFDIKMNFIPILTALVKGARANYLSKADIQQATRALVNLNTYFQESRHWSQVWNSEVVKQSWRDLWLTQEMQNATPSSEWLDTELPTLGTLDVALELWYRYLFIFSIPVPDKIPGVFQASHHSVSASYGVVCKIKRKCTLQIWDHAIAWRETNLCLSSALCKLSPFVRNALLGLMRITSALTLHHADIILPCADFFNPGWEVEIGTCQGTIEHRNTFRRKVDPVVNGITDMQKFAPVKEIKSERPTVTMLSHVWYAKDIKIALLAADIIINQWKFDDYHLDIYGAIDKAPTYSTECQEIIASKGLRGRVTLRGTADPMKVLENTWLFLNSSLSEGLPLALGEAALTGAPVVCTDVGASLRVLSDPDDFSRFSAVVAPNDAHALAKAQISLLGMLGEWSKYSDDTEPAPVLTSAPTREEVEAITRRMYTKSEQRRKLGMMTRKIVQKSFSGDRYLREHEQMLWIGKSAKMMASRAAGDPVEPSDIAAAVNNTTVDEEIITIPRSAVHSWRSSAASNMSDVYSSVSNFPLRDMRSHSRGVSNLSAVSLSQLSLSTDTESFARLPVFAPRQTLLPNVSSSGRQSPGLVPPQNFRVSFGGQQRPQSFARSISTAGREQVRGLHREDLMQYRNSDVSLNMREDFLRSHHASIQ